LTLKNRGLFVSNFPYVLWFLFYFGVCAAVLTLFVNTLADSLILSAAVYIVTLLVALSPAGEEIFRITEGIRPLATKQEREYLLPIFEEVYNEVKAKHPNISENIQLYISDSIAPNAFALGRQSIAVTRGLTEGFTAEQIKGILGHEFGHITHGDTKALILKVVGNGLFSIAIVVVRVLLKFMIGVCNAIHFEVFTSLIANVVALTLSVISIAFELAVFVTNQLGDFILTANSRNNEFLADEFSYRAGYGEELISALYDLQAMSGGGRTSLVEHLKATHPYTAERIRRLEEMG
jgi:heat shock protein HtpX